MPDVQRFRRALASYEAAGAETSTEKVIDFSETFTAWGTEVKGSEGRVAVSDDKRRQVFRLIFGVLLSGHVSKHSLQSLLGSIIYPLMHRRELMCCLTEIFVFVESMSESKLTRVGDKVKDELVLSALFMVVAFTDIRAPVSTCVSATDATVRRAGACQTWVLQKVANACFRKSETRGEHTRLRWSDFDVEHRPTKMQEPGPDVNEFVESLRWQEAIGYDFKVTEHINIQELKAIEDEIRRRTDRGEHDMCIVVCCGSRVVVGALAKGRTSSRSLSVPLRKLCVLCVAYGIQLRVSWVGTKSNPADHPSRNADIPQPGPVPDWLQRIYDQEPRDLASHGTKKGCPGLSRVTRVPPVQLPPGKRIEEKKPQWRQRFAVAGKQLGEFREYYSGCGRLSAAIARHGLPVKSFEAYPKEGYWREHDMSIAANIDREIEDARAGKIAAAHFGVVCSSWSVLNSLLNGGTRTREKTLGNGSLLREN